MHRKNILVLGMIVGIGMMAAACDTTTIEPLPPPEIVVSDTPIETPAGGQPSDGEIAEVDYVIDGDTIDVLINGQEFRVRYTGINTPEYDEPCYDDARQANINLVNGQTVRLVRDISETDPYGRLLRYVYVGETFVNQVLVEQGWAEVVVYEPDRAFADLFAVLEDQAAQAGYGCHPIGIFNDGSKTR